MGNTPTDSATARADQRWERDDAEHVPQTAPHQEARALIRLGARNRAADGPPERHSGRVDQGEADTNQDVDTGCAAPGRGRGAGRRCPRKVAGVPVSANTAMIVMRAGRSDLMEITFTDEALRDPTSSLVMTRPAMDG